VALSKAEEKKRRKKKRVVSFFVLLSVQSPRLMLGRTKVNFSRLSEGFYRKEV